MAFRIPVFLPLLILAGSLHAAPKTIRIPLISDARSGSPSLWHYTTDDPGSGWADSNFNDGAWASGAGGFGMGTVENSRITTPWTTGRIWLRAAFTLPDVPVQSLIMSLHHDDDVQVFLNGAPVFEELSYILDYSEHTDMTASALKPGRNVLAIQCTNVDGPGFVDAGLAVLAAFEATLLVGDSREAAPADWSYTTADPGADWAKPGFDANAWAVGKARFGTPDDIATATPWATPDIWIRTAFTSASAASRYVLSYLHDDGMEAFLNGHPILQDTGWNGDYEESLSDPARLAVVAGKNVLAVHCRNVSGAQFLDVGLWGLENSATTRVPPPSRTTASRHGPSLLLAGARGVDLAGLALGGRLTVFGIDGKVVAVARAGAGIRYLSLPVALGTGMFRYRWDFPPASIDGTGKIRGGSLQGTLLNIP
jgi:hypothetical protein